MKCDRLDGLVKSELAPYVLCVVIDLAQEKLHSVLKEDVWKQRSDGGIAAQKDPHV